MRILTCHPLPDRSLGLTARRRQKGMAVIVVLALVSLVLVYVAANLRTLHHLTSDLKLIERAQKQRLQSVTEAGGSATNHPVINPQGASGLPLAAKH
jgi:hypothetical protein